MKRNGSVIPAILAMLCFLSLTCDIAWALKNVCPDCVKVIKNLDRTDCPFCGKVINKCLACGQVNPIKNDNCETCNASLAESRVSRTINKQTREDLQLGESPRAKIEVELGQINDKAEKEGLTSELAARQIELLVQMSWWSKANSLASEFPSLFPDADQTAMVAACRLTALRKLGFLALEAKNKAGAREYLKTALSIDPKDTECQSLLKKAGRGK